MWASIPLKLMLQDCELCGGFEGKAESEVHCEIGRT